MSRILRRVLVSRTHEQAQRIKEFDDQMMLPCGVSGRNADRRLLALTSGATPRCENTGHASKAMYASCSGATAVRIASYTCDSSPNGSRTPFRPTPQTARLLPDVSPTPCLGSRRTGRRARTGPGAVCSIPTRASEARRHRGSETLRCWRAPARRAPDMRATHWLPRARAPPGSTLA